jgi:hypothetical protein
MDHVGCHTGLFDGVYRWDCPECRSAIFAEEAAYRDAFIAAYAKILRISAALAWCGTLMAVVFVKRVRVT